MRQRGLEYYKKKNGGLGLIVFLVHALVGLYFVNFLFPFVQVPEYLISYNNYIFFAGGVLIFFGAVNYFRASRK